MAAHLYWRLNISANNGAAEIIVYELEMYASVGGANLCTGGTATAKTYYSSTFLPSKAFDGDYVSSWKSQLSPSYPHHLTYQFATPVDVGLYEIYVIPDSPGDPNSNPKNWTFEYSDNGVNWTVVDSQTNFFFPTGTASFPVEDVHPLFVQPMLNTPVVEFIASTPITELTVVPTLSNPIANVVIDIPATPIVSTPNLSNPAVNYPQNVPANALTSTPSLNTPTASLIANTPSTALTVSLSLSNPSAMSLQRVDAIPLFSTPTVNNPTVGVINVVSAYPLYSTPSLAVNDANYLGYSYSTENKSITNYVNFSFNGSCFFSNKTLLFNDGGIYEYGGVSDDGNMIIASIKTGKMNGVMGKNGVYQSNKIKRIPDSKVLVDCDKIGGSVTVNVTADENAAYTYANAISHNGFATHRVPIGRGIKFNYVELEVIGTGCSKIDISSIEYNPKENVRRER